MLLWLIASSFLSAVAGWVLYGYFASKGQFEDLEDVKFQIFRSDEHQPPTQ